MLNVPVVGNAPKGELEIREQLSHMLDRVNTIDSMVESIDGKLFGFKPCSEIAAMPSLDSVTDLMLFINNVTIRIAEQVEAISNRI